MSFRLDRFAQLAVERFDRVGRVDHAPDFGRERQKRGHVLPGVEPCLGDDREARALLLIEALELDLGGVCVGGGVDRLEVAGDLLALAPRNVFQAQSDEVNRRRSRSGCLRRRAV